MPSWLSPGRFTSSTSWKLIAHTMPLLRKVAKESNAKQTRTKPNKKNKMATGGERSNKAPFRNPGSHNILPFWHNVSPMHYQANTDNAGSQRSGENWRGETGGENEQGQKQQLRHSGHTQSPLSNSFKHNFLQCTFSTLLDQIILCRGQRTG